MVTLLYHWNFTGANNLNLGDSIYDSESSLVAKVKRRGTYNNSGFSRSEEGIYLNNNDGENGGYYIDIEGLNNIELGGNLSIEMAVQNHKRDDFKSIYFLSVGEENSVNQAFINCRYNGLQNKDKIFFGVRTDEKNNSSGVSYTERKVSETNNTVVTDNTEHHYIFSINYDDSSSPSSSSLKIYIDGDNKGENTADLEKALTTDARSTNFIGTRKVEGSGVSYLKGVIKYLKIYQNSTSDENATTLYNKYSNSNYSWNDYSSESNSNKYLRRHNDVATYFTDNLSLTSFSILGNQLGLKNSNVEYKIYKFVSGNTINISDDFNYIPISGKDKFIIIKYNSVYFKITQTSESSNENSKYKCEISLNNTDNFSEVCTNKGFGDNYTYTNNNINFEIVFGGAEFLVNDNNNNEICFHEDTIIDTDQGQFKIKNLKSYHTINNNSVLYLIKSDTKYKELVLIKKNAFEYNKPSRDIILTENHLISINNLITPVKKLINNNSILKIKNKDNSNVYNIILFNNNFISVSNLKVNVIGVSKKSCSLLDNYKEKGVENLNLQFSKNTLVNLELSKFKNF